MLDDVRKKLRFGLAVLGSAVRIRYAPPTSPIRTSPFPLGEAVGWVIFIEPEMKGTYAEALKSIGS